MIKVSITTFVEPSLRDRFKKLAEARSRSMSNLTEILIRDYVEKAENGTIVYPKGASDILIFKD